MPLYEYECNDCGHRFELIQKFSDEPASSCPSCDGKVRKLVSSSAIQFKGTGWYITDYARKPSGGQPSASDGKTQTKDEAASSTKATSDESASKPKAESKPKSSTDGR